SKLGRVSMRAKPGELPDGLWQRIEPLLPLRRSNRPGANVTGVTFMSNKLVAKRLELLSSLVSGAAPIGMLAHALNPNIDADVRDALATATALGRTLHVE